MGKPTVLTPEVVAAIRARRKSGVGIQRIADEQGISVGSVHKALVAMRASKPPSKAQGTRSTGRKPKAPAKGRKAAAKAGAKVEPPFDALELAKAVASDLDELRKAAHLADDPAAVASMSRAITTALSLIAKLTPPPAPNLEDSPDMIAAAAKCRDKLRAMVAQAIEEGARA